MLSRSACTVFSIVRTLTSRGGARLGCRGGGEQVPGLAACAPARPRRLRAWRPLALCLLALLASALAPAASASAAPAEGIHKIQHVIVIMQENRSFDTYFGTYPGANGIPAGVCVPDPLHGGCVAPFHDPNDENYGGPHGHGAFIDDFDGGKMDGFVAEAEKAKKCAEHRTRLQPLRPNRVRARSASIRWATTTRARSQTTGRTPRTSSCRTTCTSRTPPGVGPSTCSWSPLVGHVRKGKETAGLKTRRRARGRPQRPPKPERSPPDSTKSAAVDRRHLPDAQARSELGYYIFKANEPDCEDDEAMTCAPVPPGREDPRHLEPAGRLPRRQGRRPARQYPVADKLLRRRAEDGECGLPEVSWIIPNLKVSEHPPIADLQGPGVRHDADQLAHAPPCWDTARSSSPGTIRAASTTTSSRRRSTKTATACASPASSSARTPRAGYIDHQRLSHDAYLKFIEDDFLDGAAA